MEAETLKSTPDIPPKGIYKLPTGGAFLFYGGVVTMLGNEGVASKDHTPNTGKTALDQVVTATLTQGKDFELNSKVTIDFPGSPQKGTSGEIRESRPYLIGGAPIDDHKVYKVFKGNGKCSWYLDVYLLPEGEPVKEIPVYRIVKKTSNPQTSKYEGHFGVLISVVDKGKMYTLRIYDPDQNRYITMSLPVNQVERFDGNFRVGDRVTYPGLTNPVTYRHGKVTGYRKTSGGKVTLSIETGEIKSSTSGEVTRPDIGPLPTSNPPLQTTPSDKKEKTTVTKTDSSEATRKGDNVLINRGDYRGYVAEVTTVYLDGDVHVKLTKGTSANHWVTIKKKDFRKVKGTEFKYTMGARVIPIKGHMGKVVDRDLRGGEPYYKIEGQEAWFVEGALKPEEGRDLKQYEAPENAIGFKFDVGDRIKIYTKFNAPVSEVKKDLFYGVQNVDDNDGKKGTVLAKVRASEATNIDRNFAWERLYRVIIDAGGEIYVPEVILHSPIIRKGAIERGDQVIIRDTGKVGKVTSIREKEIVVKVDDGEEVGYQESDLDKIVYDETDYGRESTYFKGEMVTVIKFIEGLEPGQILRKGKVILDQFGDLHTGKGKPFSSVSAWTRSKDRAQLIKVMNDRTKGKFRFVGRR